MMRIKDNQQGFLLIEILTGLAIMAIITVVFVKGLSTTFMGIRVSEEQVATESLAKSQIEYIKFQDYVTVADYDPGDPANRYELIDVPADLTAAGYSLEIQTPEVVIAQSEGFELQSIVVKVKRNAVGRLNITVYKLSH